MMPPRYLLQLPTHAPDRAHALGITAALGDAIRRTWQDMQYYRRQAMTRHDFSTALYTGYAADAERMLRGLLSIRHEGRRR